MKMLSFYKWIAGSMQDFTSQFRNNESLFSQARTYWSQLEASSVILIIIFFVLGIALAIYYYQPFNNRPGRHYKPIYWWLFLGLTFLLTGLVTWLYLHFSAPSNLSGVGILHFKLAIGNAVYATLLYLVCSWLWCQFNFPTNAYRFLKL